MPALRLCQEVFLVHAFRCIECRIVRFVDRMSDGLCGSVSVVNHWDDLGTLEDVLRDVRCWIQGKGWVTVKGG